MTKEAKILIVIAVLVLGVGVLLAIFFNPRSSEPGKAVDSKSLVRDTSHMTKSANAKVTLVEFGDYQCPACGAAYPKVKEALDFYKDKDVNFVFRNLPLETIHPNARISAEAAEAAGKQGKYWEMHDLLYEKQAEWSVATDPLLMLVGYAASLELNVDQFRTDVTQHLSKDIIDADISDFRSLGEQESTPTFFLNGVKVDGQAIQTVDGFKKLIDAELAK